MKRLVLLMLVLLDVSLCSACQEMEAERRDISSGKIISNTVAAVRGSKYSNILPVKLNRGEVVRIKLDTKLSINYCSLLYDDGSYLDNTGQTHLYGSWYTYTINKDTDYINICLDKSHVANSGDITASLTTVSPLLLREKMNQFWNTNTLSDLNYTLCHAYGFDISDEGILYGATTATEDAYNEHSLPTYNSCLIVANLADVEKTKRTKLFVRAGTKSTWPSMPSSFLERVGCVSPKVTGPDEVTLWCATRRWDESIQHGIIYREFFTTTFSPSTDSFGNDVVFCDIDVLGTVYPMSSKYIWDPFRNTHVISQETIDMIENIWTVTGIEHPEGPAGPRYEFLTGSNPVKCGYDGYYYTVITIGNESHALCKSLDLTHWFFVCDIPFGQISIEEGCVCFANNRLYALSRGQFGSGYDNKYSRVMFCDYDKLLERDNSNWSEPVVLYGWNNERPTIAELNGVLYLMGGLGQPSFSGGYTVPRGRKSLVTMDGDLNIITRDDMDFTYPILHFHFMSWGGQLWLYTSSDKRCLFATNNGDTRAEISFGRLDEGILKML